AAVYGNPPILFCGLNTRAGFLKYSRKLTLDPNTAHRQLLLSNRNRRATLMSEQQSYSSHPERFTECLQVLSRESLTGRCYWEVEWYGKEGYIAVAYKDISRKGDSRECEFGGNDKSWVLFCRRDYSLEFLNYKSHIYLSPPQSSRIGVYLDHRSGILSFYSVSETMTLLHRVQTTFTQPLYAGLQLLYSLGYSAELCKLK
uniref:B30.2/SPRY domain-containing protein n=1 Tax=Cyclopterus lumpus TaxID=8103 RepID=A0A8C2ZTU9_CYCLU